LATEKSKATLSTLISRHLFQATTHRKRGKEEAGRITILFLLRETNCTSVSD
jgi:hypothetical protein